MNERHSKYRHYMPSVSVKVMRGPQTLLGLHVNIKLSIPHTFHVAKKEHANVIKATLVDN